MKACGGAAQTAYPYGNNYDAAKCSAIATSVATNLQCVGGYAGLYDMSGNVVEWEDSIYSPPWMKVRRQLEY
jgi:formylglycine-generating enzyme required for sulfatase activity